MGNETVSIIMPAYNAEETIKDSILSILKQTYEDFKLYIINDNSSDSTEHIIKSIIDERIVYLLNRNGKGVGFAPIFPDICYHLTHYKPAAADIPVASDNPAHYADAIRYNARTPLQGSLLPLTRLVWA